MSWTEEYGPTSSWQWRVNRGNLFGNGHHDIGRNSIRRATTLERFEPRRFICRKSNWRRLHFADSLFNGIQVKLDLLCIALETRERLAKFVGDLK